MSRQHKASRQAAKILNDSLLGCSYSFGSVTIDTESDDHVVCFHALLLMWLLWFDLLGVDLAQLNRLVRAWITAMPVVPIDVLTDVLSECDELILHSYDVEDYPSYARLLHRLREVDDRAGLMLAPIRTLLISALHNRTTEGFRRAHQALVFVSRLTLDQATQELGRQQIQDWLNEDPSFHDWDPDSLRPFFDTHFKHFSLKNAVCRHGPGQVYECVGDKKPSIKGKYDLIRKDCRTNWLDVHIGHKPEYIVGPLNERVCRLMAVPKNARKRRIITVEPATLVWYQQGVRNALDNAIASSRYLSKHIDFSRSELNRNLAALGSIDGNYVTIDLSKASDSITLDGLRRALPSHLFASLSCARSSIAEDDEGNRHVINKFAGMGNATTFAVESLYFAAIVEQGIQEAGGDPGKSKYRVYGDDIIVEQRYAYSVIMCLDVHGFKINHLKTFLGQGTHIFRESCGGEYLDGEDVTPIRLSRGWRGLHRTPGSIQGTIDMCNSIPSSYIAIRLFLIDWLLGLPQHLRPILSSGEKGLHVVFPSTENYKKHYSEYLQCNIVRHGAVKTVYKHTDGSARRRVPKRLDGHRHLSSQIFYDDGVSEVLRYHEYLRAVRNRTSLLWPEDRVNVDIDLPDNTFWGSTSESDHF